jgi:hypothetical protein
VAIADSDSNSGGDGDAESKMNMVLLAHGILAPLCFALLFPMGAITVRLFHAHTTIWVHASWESFTYMLTLAAMGMGIWIAQMTEQLDSNHAIIGMVVISSLIFQPITGLTHHFITKNPGHRSVFTRFHIWWGRAVITLGVINGGLGLQLAGTSKTSQIVYGVLAAAFLALLGGYCGLCES